MLGLRFCVRAFSSCGERGPLFIVVRGPLTVAASLVAEHRLQTRRLSSCGSRALLLRSMCYLPRPGLEPMYPALAGRLSTTAPPGKPSKIFFDPPPRVMEIKTKINKWDLMKLQSFSTAKETINKTKRQPSEWEKVFANESMDKGLISKYINSSCSSILKKQKTQSKNGQKT